VLDATLTFSQADDTVEKIGIEPEIYQNQGRYQVLIPQGRYRTTLRANGFKAKDIILEPNQTGAVSVNVMLERSSLGRGTAIDSTGQVLAT
jgi:hypothetical protein